MGSQDSVATDVSLPIEVRAKHFQYIHNISYDFFERFYDRRTVIELYAKGLFDIHVHSSAGCLVIRKKENTDISEADCPVRNRLAVRILGSQEEAA